MTQVIQESQELNLDLSTAGEAESGEATAVLDQDQMREAEVGELVDAEFQVVPEEGQELSPEQQAENGLASSISDSEAVLASPEKPTIDPRAEMAREIENLQKEVADQACEVARRAGGLKSAKKEFDGLVEELRDLERRFESGDYGLAFDPSKSAGDQSTGSISGDVPAGTGAEPIPGQKTLPLADPNSPDKPAWRSVALSEIGLSGKLLESLEDAGLKTVGLLADYTAAGNLLTDLDGIGTGKAEKIEQACEAFWASRTTATTTTTTYAPSTIDEAREAGAETEEETAAYAAGCESCVADNGPESNPHRKGTRLWKMFDQGWQDTNSA